MTRCDFDLAADDRVQLALARRLRQVDGVLLQRPVVAFGAAALDPGAAAHLLQGAVDALLVDLESRRMRRRFAFALVGDGDQQVLDADVVVLEALCFGLGAVQHGDHTRRDIDLHGVAGNLRPLTQRARDAFDHVFDRHVETVEDLARQAVLVREQGQQYVLDIPLGVTVLSHHLLGGLDRLLGLLCEPVLSHHVVVPFAPIAHVVSSTNRGADTLAPL